MKHAILLLLLAGCGGLADYAGHSDASVVDAAVADSSDAAPDPGRIVLVSDVGCYPHAVALDAAYVYFTCLAAGTVQRMPKLGGPIQTLITGRNNPERMAVGGGMVIWTELGTGPDFIDGDVVSLPVDADGGAQPLVIASGLHHVSDVLWDQGEVYFVETGTFTDHYLADGVLWQYKGNALTKLATNLDYPIRIALDAANVYTSVNYAGTILSCARGGCGQNPVAVTSGLDQPWGVAQAGGALFLAENHGGRILRMSTAGAGLTELQSSRGLPGEILVSRNDLYWTESITREVNHSSADGGRFDTLEITAQEPTSLAVDDHSLFFADEHAGLVVRLPR